MIFLIFTFIVSLQVIGIFAGFGILLLVASPLLLLAAPCIVCCKCHVCTSGDGDDDLPLENIADPSLTAETGDGSGDPNHATETTPLNIDTRADSSGPNETANDSGGPNETTPLTKEIVDESVDPNIPNQATTP